MILPDPVELPIRRGDTYRALLNFTGADGATPLNLTGWTFRAELRATLDPGPEPAATFAVATPTSSTVTVALAATVTAALIAGTTYRWDVEAITSTGDTVTVLTVVAPVSADATHPA